MRHEVVYGEVMFRALLAVPEDATAFWESVYREMDRLSFGCACNLINVQNLEGKKCYTVVFFGPKEKATDLVAFLKPYLVPDPDSCTIMQLSGTAQVRESTLKPHREHTQKPCAE